MIKQHANHFLLSLFYPKDWVIVCEDQMFYNSQNVVSILFYNFVEFIILLYTFLVMSFAWYKEYIICLICLVSFSKFSDVLPTFTCAIAIGNLWSFCLGHVILRVEWLETLATRANILGIPFLWIALYLASDTIEE